MSQELARPFVVGSHGRSPLPTRKRLPRHVSNAWIWRPPSAMLMSLMELNQIEAFVAIVRGGGFTRASATLHLSQPAISRRLHLLEDELGAPLFERIRSGAVLTEAGRAFLPYAETLLASVHDGLDAVSALRGTDRGAITLAVVGTLASTSLTEQ